MKKVFSVLNLWEKSTRNANSNRLLNAGRERSLTSGIIKNKQQHNTSQKSRQNRYLELIYPITKNTHHEHRTRKTQGKREKSAEAVLLTEKVIFNILRLQEKVFF